MIRPEQVFLAVEPVDMRWGMERLSCHVRHHLGRPGKRAATLSAGLAARWKTSCVSVMSARWAMTTVSVSSVSFEGMKLQIPADRHRCHYVKTKVTVRRRTDGSLAFFMARASWPTMNRLAKSGHVI